MAIYKLAEDVDQFAGSIDGATFQKCCMVFALRSRKMPLKKHTAKTTRVRNRFGSFASQWRNRSGSQKTSFNSRTSLYPRENSFGDSYEVTGQNLYVSSNIRAGYINMGAINDLANPLALPISTPGSVSYDISSGVALFTISPVNVPSNHNLLTFVSRPVSPGTVSVPSRNMKLLSNIDPGNSTNFNQGTAYRALWGLLNFNAGDRIFAEYHFVMRTRGQVNLIIYTSGLVVP